MSPENVPDSTLHEQTGDRSSAVIVAGKIAKIALPVITLASFLTGTRQGIRDQKGMYLFLCSALRPRACQHDGAGHFISFHFIQFLNLNCIAIRKQRSRIKLHWNLIELLFNMKTKAWFECLEKFKKAHILWMEGLLHWFLCWILKLVNSSYVKFKLCQINSNSHWVLHGPYFWMLTSNFEQPLSFLVRLSWSGLDTRFLFLQGFLL